jgi:hypothetical protein
LRDKPFGPHAGPTGFTATKKAVVHDDARLFRSNKFHQVGGTPRYVALESCAVSPPENVDGTVVRDEFVDLLVVALILGMIAIAVRVQLALERMGRCFDRA